MSEERIDRDFMSRSPEERDELLKYTWCNECQEADLGMSEPVEYEQQGIIFVEGKCLKCGGSVYTEMDEDDA